MADNSMPMQAAIKHQVMCRDVHRWRPSSLAGLPHCVPWKVGAGLDHVAAVSLTSSPRCDMSFSSPLQMPQELTVLVNRLPLPIALPCNSNHTATQR